MLLRMFAHWWRVKDTPPRTIAAIAVVSYGANEKFLTRGSMLAVTHATRLQKTYPTAQVIYGDFKGNPNPLIELMQKKEAFPKGLYAGSAGTSFEEAGNTCAVIEALGIEGDILVVADEWFSRRARPIWRSQWSGTERKVYFSTFQWRDDERNPMKFQRRTITWALVNVVMLALMSLPGGFEFFRRRNFVQPT